MATDARQSADVVTERSSSAEAPSAREQAYERLFREGYRFDFFQTVRMLEQYFGEAPAPGVASDYRDERIRFRADTALVFPATDVKRVERVNTSPSRVCVTASFMGLYGIDSPLPYYFYDELATEADDTIPLRDFLDIFNHRLYSFFYRAWKKHRPVLHDKPNGRDQHSRRFLALSGLGTPDALEENPPVAPMRLAAFAGRLVSQQRNAQGLRALLVGLLGIEAIAIEENVSRWVTIDDRQELSSNFRLGQNATIGEKVYDRTSRFRICVGPVELDTYRTLLPGGEKANALCWLVRSYAPDYLDFEIELRLSADEVPAATLSQDDAQLGLTTFLGKPSHADITRIIHY